MPTLTLRVSEEQKRAIKARAALEGKTMTQLVVDAVVVEPGSIHEAMENIQNGDIEYMTVQEFAQQLEAIQPGCTQ